jgi:hypothetical protein
MAGGNGAESPGNPVDAGRGGGISSAGGSGTLPHAASIPTMSTVPRKRFMLLILLEALLALVLLVAIVWWTMFAGRKKGEPVRDEDAES